MNIIRSGRLHDNRKASEDEQNMATNPSTTRQPQAYEQPGNTLMYISWFTRAACCSIHMKDLLKRFPPPWLTSLARYSPRYQRLLKSIGHPPPLPNLGVRPHLLHVALIIITHILEIGKENLGVVIEVDGIYLHVRTGITSARAGVLRSWTYSLGYGSP